MGGGFNMGGGGGGLMGTPQPPPTTSGTNSASTFHVYHNMSRHSDAQAALERLAMVDWAYSGANGKPVGNNHMDIDKFPFQFMFYDNLVSWVKDPNGLQKYVKRSDNNQGQAAMLAKVGGGGGMMGGGGGGFGMNTMQMKNQQLLNNGGGGRPSFKVLWQRALSGPHLKDGISHEQFIQRAINFHMTGPQGDYGFISQKLWKTAMVTTVINGMKVFPHPIVGFDQLKSRIQNQRERAKKLSTQADRLKELARTNRATLIATKIKIENQKREQLLLRQKTIEVMKLVERLHHWNQPTQKNDILFRERINGLKAELSLPHRFRGQLDELRSQMANQQQGSHGSGTGGDALHLSSMEKERVFDFLTQQQKGLAQLTEIVRKDVRDLLIMRSRSIMEIKQAKQEQQGGRVW